MSNIKLMEVFSALKEEIRALGINVFPGKEILRSVLAREERFSFDGKETFSGPEGSYEVNYTLRIEMERAYPNYFITALTVKISGARHAARTFDLAKAEYFSIRQAVNLLAGRCAFKLTQGGKGIVGGWYKLNYDTVDANGNAQLQNIDDVPGAMEERLDSFPIEDIASREQILDSLYVGDIVQVKWHEGKAPTYIHADPEHHTIVAFSLLNQR